MSDEPRSPLYLLTGLVIGLVFGLLFAWKIAPVRYSDTSPNMLGERYRDDYRRLIALAYRADGDVGRAQQRLALLKDEDPAKALSAQAQQMLSDGSTVEEARALANLSGAYNSAPTPVIPQATATRPAPATLAPGVIPTATLDPALAIRTPTAVPSPTPTLTPTITLTPRATFTPRPTLPAVYRLISQQEICDPTLPEGQIQVEVLDENGTPLPGVRVTAAWNGGEEAFVTGLYPEISPGYANYILQPDIEYSFTAGEGSQPVKGITAPTCSDSGGVPYRGGWSLKFSQ